MSNKLKKSIKKKSTRKKTSTSKKKTNKCTINKEQSIKKDIPKKGIIVLDLDETLFHTENNDIYWRPNLRNFITYISKHFYLVVYLSNNHTT